MPALPARCQYAIIGSGVAGMAAAQAIRNTDSHAQITMLSDDPAGYYSRPGLAYFLTGEVSEDQLFPMSKKDLKALNLNWQNTRVESILPAGHQLVLANGSRLYYDRLLIATGSQAAPLRIPGTGLKGVFKLDHLADARALMKSCRKARAAVVTGGGITALELVEGLRAQGLEVHYILRGERYWSNVLDETESRLVESRLVEEGVQIHFNSEITEILGQRDQVSGVKLKDGGRIRCGLAAIAIGALPRAGLARAAGLNVDRGILVDPFLQTSAPDIYAAGDVAQVYDPHTGLSLLDTLWNTAREQGQAAGLNMAGRPARYRKSLPLNVTRLAGLTTTIIGTVNKGADPSLSGISRGDSETWRQLSVHTVAETRQECNRLRLLVGEKRLLGAVIMGDQVVSLPLQELIAHQADITPIRAALLHTAHLAEIIKSFWTKWRTANHAIANQ